jgi:hypothetical protein
MSKSRGKVGVNERQDVKQFRHTPTTFDKEIRIARKHPDNVWRLDKSPSARLNVRMTIEISGKLRRADLDRFAQAMSKTISFEFEDGGNGT